MKCAEVGRLVDRYVDGRLAAERRAGLEQHAETCAACRRRIAEARQLSRILASDDAAARAPRGFADRVMERVYRETLWKPAAPRGAAAGGAARGYRRLGLCVMLGAAALVACLVVPKAGLLPVAGSGLAGNGSVVVERMLDGADGAVRGVLSAANGSASRIVEGRSR